MLKLYVLFPGEYGPEFAKEPHLKDFLLAVIKQDFTEEFGQEAEVAKWEIVDGPAPVHPDPGVLIGIVGIDFFSSENLSVSYAKEEIEMDGLENAGPVGVCFVRDKETG